MKTALGILKEKHLLIEDDKTCEAHTHLVIEAIEEYARHARIDENKYWKNNYPMSESQFVEPFENRIKELLEIKALYNAAKAVRELHFWHKFSRKEKKIIHAEIRKQIKDGESNDTK